ncbi:MAG: S24/S26 family peptidase [Proteiniphilum sp.]|jgi:hypothetical protein|nr:S24/S26 family peptidase [Proteiniphilum sp.]
METKVIENSLFFSEVDSRISAGEKVRIRAGGNSMLPFIRDNRDEIILQKTHERSFRKGNLLLVRLKDKRFVLHRIAKLNDHTVILRGDGNLSIFETCTRSDVIAEVSAVLRDGSRAITKGSFRWNAYRYLWPGNSILRRVGLALYRKIPFLH